MPVNNLPAPAQEKLFTDIDRLSAPGSRVAVEVFGKDDQQRAFMDQQKQLRADRDQRGHDVSFDPYQLWYEDGDGPGCAEFFESRGWTVRTVDSHAEARRLGRPIPMPEGQLPLISGFLTAISG